MYIRVHPQNPEARKIAQVVECLQNDGIIIYPTDTVYGIGCSIYSKKAIERLYQIKQLNEKTAQLSFIAQNISDLSQYIASLDTATFKLLKRTLPGPYTFIVQANKELHKLLKMKRNTVGVRIPNNEICQAMLKELGHPIISTSLPLRDGIEDYTDPEVFEEYFSNSVDIIIDGGTGGYIASTVVDCTTETHSIIREGAGDINIL
jgi:tRNA threonylcarbamoyl adenosine modification protein (Sua5/YciO/YrdC/YwlC family)